MTDQHVTGAKTTRNKSSSNFSLILLTQWLTKIADTCASAKTVLPWLLATSGAPALVIGLLVPLRESGSLIPQIILGSYLRGYTRRKWFYVVACLLQGISVGGMVSAVLWLNGASMGWIILCCLGALSASRAIASIAIKDVIGRTIPKTKRGRLNGLSASLSGITGLAVVAFFLITQSSSFVLGISLLLIAATSFIIAALFFLNVVEPQSDESQSTTGIKQAFTNIALLKTDPHFQHFVVTRALLMTIGLGMPFIVLKATATDINNLVLYFMAASAIASLVSGPFWGAMSDRSSKWVIGLAAGLSSGLFFMIAGLSLLLPLVNPTLKFFLYVFAFFLLSLAHQGARIGRKTYVINMATGNTRTDYVSVSNTIIGLLLLAFGAISAVIAQWDLIYVVLLFAFLSLAALFSSTRLKEVE